MAQVKQLVEKLFENDYIPTEAEEAVLEKLEAEWLAMCRANELEDFDFWQTAGGLQ